MQCWRRCWTNQRKLSGNDSQRKTRYRTTCTNGSRRQFCRKARRIAELEQRRLEADTLHAEEKHRKIKFENERTEGKYGLVEDFQRELDGILIRLQTNLYSVPEQVVDSIMTSRDRVEAKEILESALEHHMRDVADWNINLPEGAQD